MNSTALALCRGNEVVTPPSGAALDLDLLKQHLRVDADVEDAYLQGLAAGVAAHTERFLRRSFLTQTRRAWFDEVSCDGFVLDYGPIQTLTSVTSYALDDTATVAPGTVYQLDKVTEPARVTLRYSQIWPVNLRASNAYALQYVAGYGTTSESLPQDLVIGMWLLAGLWYRNREPVMLGSITQLPWVQSLLIPHRLDSGLA